MVPVHNRHPQEGRTLENSLVSVSSPAPAAAAPPRTPCERKALRQGRAADASGAQSSRGSLRPALRSWGPAAPRTRLNHNAGKGTAETKSHGEQPNVTFSTFITSHQLYQVPQTNLAEPLPTFKALQKFG